MFKIFSFYKSMIYIMTQDGDFKTLFNDLLSYRLTTTYFGVQNNQGQIKFKKKNQFQIYEFWSQLWKLYILNGTTIYCHQARRIM